jgi:hypothetical protein
MTKEELKHKLLNYDTEYVSQVRPYEGQVRMTDGFAFKDDVMDMFTEEELKKYSDVKLIPYPEKGINQWKIKLI